MSEFARLLLLSVALTGAASAECVMPPRAAVPDGATATREEMFAAHASAEEHLARLELYLDCIRRESETAEQPQAPGQDIRYRELRAAALSQMRDLVERFNKEVHLHRTRPTADTRQ